MADLDYAAQILHRMYVDAGHPVVQVTPPAQTIVAGKVVLQVVEDRISSVTVTGNTAYNADNIKNSLPPLQLSRSLNVNRLERAITLANENTAKQVSVNVKPGDKLGDVDAAITVTEDKVSKLMLTFDNTGSPSTGPNKLNLAYQYANLFNLDHALTAQFGTSPSYAQDMYNFSLGYHIPFYKQGVSIDLTTAYSNSSTSSNGLFFAGKGYVTGGRLNYPLPNWADIHQKLVFGADYKTNNNTVSGATTAGTITEIPGSAMYYLQFARPTFQGNGSITYVSNIHGGSHADTASYQAARAPLGTRQAGPIWDLWRLNATGGLSLQADWQARMTLNGQFTNDLLIPAEKIGLGGATSVRGYPERIVDGDNGYTANFELYTPDIKKFQAGGYITSFRALAFVDAGRVTWNDVVSSTVAPTTFELYSYGIGLRLTGTKNTSLKLDLGIAQKAFFNATNNIKKGDARANFSFSSYF